MVHGRSREIDMTSLAGIGMILLGMSAMLLGVLGVSVAGATPPNPEHKITLCHRTDSYSNPYVTESVDVASALFEGHDGHNGPVFYAAIPKGTKWGDIIPAFDFGPGEQYGGKNLPTGQAILDNDCTASDAVTTTSTTQPNEQKVYVLGPDGKVLGSIPTPINFITVAFSGPDKKTLYGVANNQRFDEIFTIQMIAQGYKGRAK